MADNHTEWGYDNKRPVGVEECLPHIGPAGRPRNADKSGQRQDPSDGQQHREEPLPQLTGVGTEVSLPTLATEHVRHSRRRYPTMVRQRHRLGEQSSSDVPIDFH
jgi:hypothetical protein